MGEFVVFFFTVLFLAIGFLLLWNGNSLQGHCCSTTDDSGVCSTVTSKTDCGGNCKWQYWNCDGPFPWQSNYNGPGKADCPECDCSQCDCPECDCPECDCSQCDTNLDNCKNSLYKPCLYSKTTDNNTENDLTAAGLCNRFNYEQKGANCTTLKPVNNKESATYQPSENIKVTVDCTKTTASFPGCKWVPNETKKDQCVLNSS